jgi:predicted nucleic acid-binding protein
MNTFLVDANVLVAACFAEHAHHKQVMAWLRGKSIAVSPLGQLALVRLAMQVYGADGAAAKKLLAEFMKGKKFMPDDFSAEQLNPVQGHKQWNDSYLHRLAVRHKMKFATLDSAIHGDAVEVIG